MTNPRELAAEKPQARKRTVARPDLPTPSMMLVDPRFGELAGQFFRLFGQPSDGGGALALYLHGEPVVDIWSGWAARDTRWQSDTVSVSFSTGKGVASTVLHRAGGPRTDRLRRPSPRIGPSSRVPARSW